MILVWIVIFAAVLGIMVRKGNVVDRRCSPGVRFVYWITAWVLSLALATSGLAALFGLI